MGDANLFTLLSSYRPGSAASPFENYCTSGLAYLLGRGHRMLTALFATAAGAYGESVALVEVQPELGDAGLADLVLTFENGVRGLVEVQVESAADERLLPALEASAAGWVAPPVLVMLTLPGSPGRPGWQHVSWLDVAEALDGDPDPLASEFAEFVQRDILGFGPVPLEQAIATNRLYALGGAALRRRFGDRVRYENSASRPIGGRYRYLGTTFALDGGEMEYWAGLVNESVPLSEHYHLMLASKSAALDDASDHPRATGDWKWAHWTGAGRVVRPIEAQEYDTLLSRLEA